MSLKIPQTVRRLLPVIISLGIIGLAASVLWRSLAHIDPRAVLHHLQALPVLLVLASLLATSAA